MTYAVKFSSSVNEKRTRITQYVQYQWNGAAERAQIFDRVIDVLLEDLEPYRDRPILDVGSGNGDMVDYLVGRGFDAYGIEPSTQGMEQSVQRMNGRVMDAIRFLEFDATRPFTELPQNWQIARFPVLYSLEVIEHVYDPRAFIRFCRDALQAAGGGQLLLTTPYHGRVKDFFIGLKGGWDEQHNPLWDCGHIKFWSRRTLTQLVEEAGFKVTRFVGLGRRVPYLWKNMYLRCELPPR